MSQGPPPVFLFAAKKYDYDVEKTIQHLARTYEAFGGTNHTFSFCNRQARATPSSPCIATDALP